MKRTKKDIRFSDVEMLVAYFLMNESGQNDHMIKVLQAVHLLSSFTNKPNLISAGVLAKGLAKHFNLLVTGKQLWHFKHYLRSIMNGMKQTVKYT